MRFSGQDGAGIKYEQPDSRREVATCTGANSKLQNHLLNSLLSYSAIFTDLQPNNLDLDIYQLLWVKYQEPTWSELSTVEIE